MVAIGLTQHKTKVTIFDFKSDTYIKLTAAMTDEYCNIAGAPFLRC